MLEKIASEVMEKETKKNIIGYYDPRAVDEPKRNPLHPESLSEEQIQRYGRCHEMAIKFAEESQADVFTTSNGKHSIAVKDNMVYDYVLGYNLDISLDEYLRKVPYAFEKKSSE